MQKFFFTISSLLVIFFYIIIPVTVHADSIQIYSPPGSNSGISQIGITPIASAQASAMTVNIYGYYATENGVEKWFTTDPAKVSFFHDDSTIRIDYDNGTYLEDDYGIAAYQWCFDAGPGNFDWNNLSSPLGAVITWTDMLENEIYFDKYLWTSVRDVRPLYEYTEPGTYYAHLRILDKSDSPLFDTDSITINVVANQVDAPNPVPEPATMILFGVGLLGIAGVSRKKK